VIFTTFVVHVAYGRGSVLLQWGDESTRSGGKFMGGFFPTDNALYWPYSGINFAMKDRFGLTL